MRRTISDIAKFNKPQTNALQNLQLLLHIPDLSSLDAATSVSWQLFDRNPGLLREGAGPLTAADSVPRAERTVIVIPARRVVCIETPLPPVSAQKRDALLRYAIEDKLTIDPATVHAVVLGTSAGSKSNTYVVAAIDRAWLSGVLRWLANVGIEPAQAVSAAALIPAANGEWGLQLDGTHGLARRPDGFAYSFDVDVRDGIPIEPPFALTLALKEARDSQLSPTQLVVYVDKPTIAATGAPWSGAWQTALGYPVRVAARGAPHMPPMNAGNLLSGDFAPRTASRGWMALLKPALAFAAAIAVVQLAFTVLDAWRLDQRRRALEGEMGQVFKTSFPKAQAIVDPPLQMQRNLDAMKREAGIATANDARAVLASLTTIVKVVPGLTPQSITIADGIVSVSASVPDPRQQAMLKSRAADVRGAAFAVDATNNVRLTMKAERP